MKTNKLLVAAMIPALLLMFAGNTLSAQEKTPEKPCKGQEQKHDGSGCQKHDGSGCQMHSNAEPEGPFRNFLKIPGIDEKLTAEIRKIRLNLIKDILGIRDQIMEKEAQLRTLTRSDQPDSKAIDRLIDEIAELQAKSRKRIEKARQQIRGLLNEEQKLWFDSHCQGPHMEAAGPGHPEGCQHPSGKKMKNRH